MYFNFEVFLLDRCSNPKLLYAISFIYSAFIFNTAAEIMASNCVYPTLPVPLPMPPYDHLPVHRFLHFADGGVGSRKCRRQILYSNECTNMNLSLNKPYIQYSVVYQYYYSGTVVSGVSVIGEQVTAVGRTVATMIPIHPIAGHP